MVTPQLKDGKNGHLFDCGVSLLILNS